MEHFMKGTLVAAALPSALVCSAQTPVTILLMNMLPVAAMLIETDGRIVQTNPAARILMDLKDGLESSTDDCILASLPADNSRLWGVFQRFTAKTATDDRENPLLPLWIHRPSGYPSFLLTFDAVPQWRSSEAPGKSILLLRILDQVQEIGVRTHPLRTAFSLTLAESIVAEQIAVGRSPREAAEHLGLSRNTVRTHLARIFDKTGVRSQHALVRLLMALSSGPVA